MSLAESSDFGVILEFGAEFSDFGVIKIAM